MRATHSPRGPSRKRRVESRVIARVPLSSGPGDRSRTPCPFSVNLDRRTLYGIRRALGEDGASADQRAPLVRPAPDGRRQSPCR
jgi:hypothetical protein